MRCNNPRSMKLNQERAWKKQDIFGSKKDRFKKLEPAFRVVPPTDG